MNNSDLVLSFYRGNDKRIIARNSDGKICLLDIPYCQANHLYVNVNEDWLCEVKEEKENAIIIRPIKKLLSAEENAELFENKMKRLKEKFSAAGKARAEKGKPGRRVTSKPSLCPGRSLETDLSERAPDVASENKDKIYPELV